MLRKMQKPKKKKIINKTSQVTVFLVQSTSGFGFEGCGWRFPCFLAAAIKQFIVSLAMCQVVNILCDSRGSFILHYAIYGLIGACSAMTHMYARRLSFH